MATDGVSPLALLLIGVLFGMISAAAGVFLARTRGVSPVLGGAVAFVLPFVGLLVILVIGDRGSGEAEPADAEPEPEPEPDPEPEPEQPVEGWWAVDPTGRFAQRWWDGAAWTVHVVSADGTRSTDAGE